MLIHDLELAQVYESDDCRTVPIDGTRFAGIQTFGEWRVLDIVTGMSESLKTFATKNADLSKSILEGIAIADATELDEGIDDKQSLKAIFLAGAGGVGKSSIAAAAFGGEGFKEINLDPRFETLLNKAGVPLGQCLKRNDLYQDAASLRDKEKRQYRDRRLGLIIDGTAKHYESVHDSVSMLEEIGYDCYMVFIDVSLDRAIRGNQKRAERGGRDVGKENIETAWKGANANKEAYKRLFGPRYFEFDNTEEVSPDEFKKIIVPKVRKLFGNKILAAPIQNPIGKAWIEEQKRLAKM
jgi:chloramphenicol 3-O-phosphotransferase